MFERFWEWYRYPEVKDRADFYVEWIELRILFPLLCPAFTIAWPYSIVRYGEAGGSVVTVSFIASCFVFAVIPNIVLSCLNLLRS